MARCEGVQPASRAEDTGRPFGRAEAMRDDGGLRCGVQFVESWRKRIGDAEEGGSSPSGTRQPARVEIWIAPVASLVRRIPGHDMLSADEVLQFDQIRAASARDGRIAARMLLRLALSHVVQGQIAPQGWRLTTSPDGKLEIGEELPQLHFSVAHTERLAVVATSERLPVGIDAESIEQPVESHVARDFCCPGERAALEKLPPPQSAREFVRLWTLKEAYAKLTGRAADIDFSLLGFSFESLRLTDTPPTERELQTHFETLFVATGNGLSHVSVAIGMSRPFGAELQVMTLVSDAGWPAIHAPCIASVVEAPPTTRTM
jgi:phosphopantetheinyl transferase